MAQWQRQLGEAYVGLGQLTEGRAHAELALKLLGTPVPTSSLGFIFSTAYQVCVQIIHRISPTTFIIRNGDDRQRCQEAACAFERLAHIAYYAQDVPSIIYAAIRCLNLGENGGPSAQLARSYVLGLAASMLPVHWIARLYAKLADAAAVDLKDIHARAWVLELSGLYAFGLGEWDDGKGRLVEAVRITAEIGDWRRWEESFAQLSILHYYLGNFHESAQYFNELVTVSKKRSHEQSQAWALCGRCVNALRLGFIDEAFRFAEASDALPLDDLGFPERIWCKGLLAVTRWRCGDRNGALEAARATANLTRRTRPTATYALEGYAAVAEVNLANWETEDAASQETSNKKLARDACQQLRQYARVIPIAQPRARLWQGLFYWLGGDETKAMKEWLASLAAAKRYSMPFDEGLAHFEIGRHLGKSDPQRAEHLRAATAIFERLEARYDLERARALLS
jgi:tetratricopeptide (TPR) repeat protein